MKYIVVTIDDIIKNPPTFREALAHLEKIKDQENTLNGVRDMLILVMEADTCIMEKEMAFLEAYDIKVKELLEQ